MKRVVMIAALLLCGAGAEAEGVKGAAAPPPVVAAPAPPEALSAPTPEGHEAARGIARTVLVDSGVIRTAIDVAFTQRLPELRAQLSPDLSGLTPAQRRAIDGQIATLPTILLEEIDRVTPALIERMASELDTQFTEADLVALDAFLGSPEGLSVLRRGVDGAIRAQANGGDANASILSSMVRGMTPAEMQAWAAFGDSDAGRAFADHGDMFGQRMEQMVLEGLMPALPATLGRFQQGLCQALGRDCPQSLRPL